MLPQLPFIGKRHKKRPSRPPEMGEKARIIQYFEQPPELRAGSIHCKLLPSLAELDLKDISEA